MPGPGCLRTAGPLLSCPADATGSSCCSTTRVCNESPHPCAPVEPHRARPPVLAIAPTAWFPPHPDPSRSLAVPFGSSSLGSLAVSLAPRQPPPSVSSGQPTSCGVVEEGGLRCGAKRNQRRPPSSIAGETGDRGGERGAQRPTRKPDTAGSRRRCRRRRDSRRRMGSRGAGRPLASGSLMRIPGAIRTCFRTSGRAPVAASTAAARPRGCQSGSDSPGNLRPWLRAAAPNFSSA